VDEDGPLREAAVGGLVNDLDVAVSVFGDGHGVALRMGTRVWERLF